MFGGQLKAIVDSTSTQNAAAPTAAAPGPLGIGGQLAAVGGPASAAGPAVAGRGFFGMGGRALGVGSPELDAQQYAQAWGQLSKPMQDGVGEMAPVSQVGNAMQGPEGLAAPAPVGVTAGSLAGFADAASKAAAVKMAMKNRKGAAPAESLGAIGNAMERFVGKPATPRPVADRAAEMGDYMREWSQPSNISDGA